MEILDPLAEARLTTPAGLVLLHVAGHADGALSVVAQLMPDGRRVGYLRAAPDRRQRPTAVVDRAVVGPPVMAAMRRLLSAADTSRLRRYGSHRGEPTGGHLASSTPRRWHAGPASPRYVE